MSHNLIATGVVHEVPQELKELLLSNKQLLEQWNTLTPLARNEWICRTTMAKKEETRVKRRKRLHEDISHGKKRPCCRPGCPHRRESAKKWFKEK
jgi:uncharacterized protein YdeI (YjbR/CyaY-like superfamily)